jgi:predicted TIM-barrel fold metal-dependent hydrolase
MRRQLAWGYCSTHPFFDGFKEELKRTQEEATGVGLHPEFQNFYVDDEKAFPPYEELRRLKIPILLRCRGDARPAPEGVLKIDKFSGLKIIAARAVS